MTKKDYELIAKAINAVVWNYQGEKQAQDAIYTLVETLAEALGQKNARFNKDKFIELANKK